jgi:uronate dehydrogenase
VVVTGAEGKVGQAVCRAYLSLPPDAYRVRLAVREDGFSDDRFSDVVQFDLTQPRSVDQAVNGARAILHLAAEPRHEATMGELVGANIIGASTLFDSARRVGCERIVFASSIHAVLGVSPDYQPHADEPPRPDCLYGATKVFGEALCSVYAHQHGMSCIAVRIGAFVPAAKVERWVVTDRNFLGMGITEDDLTQLLHLCLIAPKSVRFAIINGVSDNRYKSLEIESARALVGYHPRDDLFRVAEEVAAREQG